MSFTDPKAAVKFITAGKAVFTLESEKTGMHFTYRVNQPKDGGIHFVSVLTGPNNSNDFTYAGILRGAPMEFKTTAKAKISADALSVRAFVWFWDRISAGRIPAECVMHHMGACGRCGRALTTPESVERGIGPECAVQMGLVDQPRRRRPRQVTEGMRPPVKREAAGPAWINT